jgi:hypothetical protein
MSDWLCPDDNNILSTLLLTGDNKVGESIEVAQLLFCLLYSRRTASWGLWETCCMVLHRALSSVWYRIKDRIRRNKESAATAKHLGSCDPVAYTQSVCRITPQFCPFLHLLLLLGLFLQFSGFTQIENTVIYLKSCDMLTLTSRKQTVGLAYVT